MDKRQALAVVLVTYNRKHDLKITLTQLASMQGEFDHLIVVNNCSTDGTAELLETMRPEFSIDFQTLLLDDNLGGAGGFHAGVRAAEKLPVEWIWMSDDDAIPQPGSLATIVANADNEENTYGSTAVAKQSETEELCWPAVVIDDGDEKGRSIIFSKGELQPTQEVAMLPFLGMMVSKRKVQQVGLPNAAYFISGDDVEYCIRLQASGSRLIQVRDSVIRHPEIPRYLVKFFGRTIYCLRMPAWRRYFDIRNRIWNSRLANGRPGAIATATVLLPRLIFTLLFEQEREGQVGAYFRGITDGLFAYVKSGNSSGTLK